MENFLPQLMEDKQKGFSLMYVNTPKGVLYDAAYVCKTLGYSNLELETNSN